MSVKIKGTSGAEADVLTGGHLKVATPTDPTKAGYTGILGFNDPAGTIRIPVAGSSQGLLGMANVDIDFEEGFAATAISPSKWKTLLTTMTATTANNFVTLNASNTLTSGSNAQLVSWRAFEFGRGADRIIGWRARITGVVTGVNVEIGAPLASGTSAPTGGVFFRLSPSGVLTGVAVTVALTEIETAPMTIPDVNAFHDWVIIVAKDFIYFQIDDVIVGVIPIGDTSPSPVVSECSVAACRIVNTAVVSTPVQVHCARCVSAFFGGRYQYSSEVLAAMAGDVAAQGITGSGTGSLANWANNAAPSAATLSNTAAGYTTLGGQFLFNAVAGAETDYALFGFLVPALTATNKGNTLIVRGITISTYSTGAAVGSDTILQWGVGFGSSAVSLATADALTGTKAPRRIPVGIQKFAAATTNSVAENIFVKFSQPFPVNPSEYFHVILKMPLGAATASLTFRGTVTIDGTWV